jgi:cellobiose phosphorylase
LLNPIYQADTEEKVAGYRVEPYAICADIYSASPYLRRGGWTWYTGSAAWMYRLGLEGILGFQKIGNRLKIDPVLPPSWDGYEMTYRFGKTTYHIQVDNPYHAAQHVQQITLDGELLVDRTVPLVDDGKEHQVEVKLIVEGPKIVEGINDRLS